MKTWTFALTRAIRRSLLLSHPSSRDPQRPTLFGASVGWCPGSHAKVIAGSLLGVQRPPATGRGIPGSPPQAFPPCSLQPGLGPAPLDTRRQMLLARNRAGMPPDDWPIACSPTPCRAPSLHSTRHTAAPKKNLPLLCLPKMPPLVVHLSRGAHGAHDPL